MLIFFFFFDLGGGTVSFRCRCLYAVCRALFWRFLLWW